MLFSGRDIFKITVPLIIQQVLEVTMGMVDSLMVASAGEAAVSGVSLVNTLDNLLIISFGSLVAGGTVVVSQFLGKKDMKLVHSASKQLIYTATGVALVLAVLVILGRVPLLSLLFGDVETAVMDSALSYFFYIAFSFPFFALYSAGTALFRSMGKSALSLMVSLGMNLVNLAGNAVLIYALQMGAAGAAIATLISRIVGAIVIIALLHNKKYPVYLEKLWQYRPDKSIIHKILYIGVPNGIESGMFQFGKLLTQTLISTMGTAAIAANAVANSLVNYQYMLGNAIGSAMIIIVGRCVGAKEKEQAKKYCRTLVGMGYACLWVIVLLTFLFGKNMIGWYHLSPASAETARELIIYHGICAAIMWPLAFTLPYAFRAASDVKFPMVVSVASMWVFRVVLSYIIAPEVVSVGNLTFPGLGMGVLGVWVAMTIDWVFRTVLFVVRYHSGKWQREML